MTKGKSNSVREKAKRAQLSCFTCRARKVKCDRLLPCAACAQYRNPEGCKYDMSDDKRQPILLADANKQLRQENVELKAKNQERLCENEVLKIENEEMRVLAVDLRSKLIAIEHDSLQDTYQSTIQVPWSCKYGSLHSSPDHIIHDARSSKADSTTIVCTPNSIHSESVVTRNSITSGATVQEDSVTNPDDCVHSIVLAQVLASVDDIMSRSRISKTCSSLALIQSIRDLVAVLATLPMDLRFTNTWLNPLTHASLGRPSFQIVVLFQNVHEYIMVSLVRFSQRGGTTDTGQYPIRLPEPLQTQMIVSCLEIMAILDYFMLQRQEEALLNTHIFHQTSIAADILGWPDLLPHIPPYRIYIVRIITHLRHLFHQQPQLSPEATLNALAQLLSMVDQHTVEHSIQGPRVSADSVTYAPRQSIEPVIDCWHVDPSMELVRHGPLNRQADLQARSSLDKNYLENEVLVGFDCGGVLVPSNQPSWGLIGDTRFDHKHEDSFQVVCDGDKFRTRSSTSASQGQNSRALSDANLTATHALLCYSSSSTVSMSSMLDPSYPASAYTPSSSQYSHPVTPVADQNMVNEHEAGPQLLDRMEREGGDGQQFWTCSYV